MQKKVFINLPVKNPQKSKEFFLELGYSINNQFSNHLAVAVVISETIYCMLLEESFFAGFTPKPVSNAQTGTEVLIALDCESKSEVDTMLTQALSAGATQMREKQDLGFMYSCAFADPDGHIWEYFWMDPEHIQQ